MKAKNNNRCHCTCSKKDCAHWWRWVGVRLWAGVRAFALLFVMPFSRLNLKKVNKEHGSGVMLYYYCLFYLPIVWILMGLLSLPAILNNL